MIKINIKEILEKLQLKNMIYQENDFVAVVIIHNRVGDIDGQIRTKFLKSIKGESDMITQIKNWLNGKGENGIIYNESMYDLLNGVREDCIREKNIISYETSEFKLGKLPRSKRIEILLAKLDVKIEDALDNNDKTAFNINANRRNKVNGIASVLLK